LLVALPYSPGEGGAAWPEKPITMILATRRAAAGLVARGWCRS
jgi:hypothetical protein